MPAVGNQGLPYSPPPRHRRRRGPKPGPVFQGGRKPRYTRPRKAYRVSRAEKARVQRHVATYAARSVNKSPSIFGVHLPQIDVSPSVLTHPSIPIPGLSSGLGPTAKITHPSTKVSPLDVAINAAPELAAGKLAEAALALRAARAARGAETAGEAARAAKAARVAEESAAQASRARRAARVVRHPVKAGERAAGRGVRAGARRAAGTKAGRAVVRAGKHPAAIKAGRAAGKGYKVARPVVKTATYPIRKPIKGGLIAQAPVVATTGSTSSLGHPGIIGTALNKVGATAGSAVPGVAGNLLKDAFNLPAVAVPSLYLPLAGAVHAAAHGGDTSQLSALLDQYKRSGLLPAIFKGDTKQALHAITTHPLYSALEVSGLYAGVGRGLGGALRKGTGNRLAAVKREPLHIVGKEAQLRDYSKNVFTREFQKANEARQRRQGRNPNVATEKQARRYISGALIEGHRRGAVGVIHRFIEQHELRRRENRTRLLNEHGKAAPKKYRHVVAEAVQASLRSPQTFHADVRTRVAELDAEAASGTLTKAELELNRRLADDLRKSGNASEKEVAAIFASAHRYAREHNLTTSEAVGKGLYDASQVERSRLFPYVLRHMGGSHGIPEHVPRRLAEIAAEAKAVRRQAGAAERGAAGNVRLSRRQENIARSGQEQARVTLARGTLGSREKPIRLQTDAKAMQKQLESLPPNAYVWVYHGTGDPAFAATLRREGVRPGGKVSQTPGTMSRAVYITARERGAQGHAGPEGQVVAMRVRVGDITRSPERALTGSQSAAQSLAHGEGIVENVPPRDVRVLPLEAARARAKQAGQQVTGDIRTVRGAARERGVVEAGAGRIRELRAEMKAVKRTPAQLLDAQGRPLTTAQIHAHMRANGVDPATVGFLSHAPGITSARSFNQRAHSRAQIARAQRTGANFRHGVYDASYEALAGQHAYTQGQVDRAATIDALIVDHGIRAPGGGYFRNRSGAENVAAATGGNVPLVPMEITPWLSLRRELEAARKSGLRSAQLDPSLVDPVMQGFEKSLSAQNGRFVLVPETMVKSLQDHFKAANPLQRGASSLTQAFKYTVLPTSDKWIMGNVLDQGLRAALSGINPIPGVSRYNRVGRQVLNRLEARHGKEARATIERQMISGGHYSQRANYHINQDAQGLAGAFHKLAQKPVAKQVAGTYGWYAKNVFRMNGWMERQMELAGLGKVALEEVRRNNTTWETALHVQKGALDDLAHGLLNTDKQVAFAHSVEDIFGRWRGNSPMARAVITGYSPFYLWARNASRFILLTLPTKHPIKVALLAAAATATEKERKKLGLDLFADRPLPGFLQGGLPGPINVGPVHIPEGGVIPSQYYTSAGVFANYPDFLSNVILPYVSGAQAAAGGFSWTGNRLTNADKTPITNPLVLGGLAANSFAEGIVPFLSIGRRVLEGGGSSGPRSTIFTPQTTPGTAPGGKPTIGSGAKRVYVPRTYDKSTVEFLRQQLQEQTISIPPSRGGSSGGSSGGGWGGGSSGGGW